MEKTHKIEKKVAKTMLEDSLEVTLGGKTYKVAPPTFATLLRVSGLIATLPTDDGERGFDDKAILKRLSTAEDYKAVPEIIATLIIGESQRTCKTRLLEAFTLRGNRINKLAKEIAYNARIDEMSNALKLLIENMALGDFFVLTTFLTGMNMAKSSREVETKTMEV